MKKSVLPFLLGVVFTLTCIVILISPWWHLFTSSTKHANCLPLDYPEYPFNYPADRSTPEPYIPEVFRTETAITIVKDYYEANLTHNPNWNYDDEQGYWSRSEVRPGEFLYECGGRLNWEEIERGCIYLRERDGLTVIDRIWLYSPSAAPSCSAFFSELPISY